MSGYITPRSDDMESDKLDWRYFKPELQRDIDLENLRDGMKRRDFEKIQKVFNECEWLDKLGTTDESDTEDDGSLTSRRKDDLDNKIKKDVVQAKKIKRIEKLKKEFLDLSRENDPEFIKVEIERLKKENEGYLDEALDELLKARMRKWKLTEGRKFRDQYESQKFSLSPAMINEIRRYKQPTTLVHKIMKATLLLLGESEVLTKNWSHCQKCCSSQGENSIINKMINYEPNKLLIPIAAKAENLLDSLSDGSDIRASNPSAYALYVWTRDKIELYKELADNNFPKVNNLTELREQEILNAYRREEMTRKYNDVMKLKELRNNKVTSTNNSSASSNK